MRAATLKERPPFPLMRQMVELGSSSVVVGHDEDKEGPPGR